MDLRQFIEEPRKMDEPIPDENLKRGDYGRLLHQWQGPEFEVYEKSDQWYAWAGIFLLVIVVYAMFTNGPIMAITFIMVGIVGYIQLQKDPRNVNFAITTEGIIADKDIYLFENVYSFWIFYDPHHTKIISLHTKASMLPFVHIPLQDEDPVQVREILLPYIPEIKQEPSMVDTIEKLLHI